MVVMWKKHFGDELDVFIRINWSGKEFRFGFFVLVR